MIVKINEMEIETEIIRGGMSYDDDMTAFNDYYDTVYRMYNLMLKKGCIEPFTLISEREVKEQTGSGNHVCKIAINYAVDITLTTLNDIGETKGVIKEVVVNERDYILSQKWIKEWIIVDHGILGKDFECYLMMTDGKYGIITGSLDIIW